MSILNSLLRSVFDAVLYPFSDLSPLVGITLISAVIGVAMLYVFKWTSDQDAMDAVKRRIDASLFEIRLFNDDLRAIFRAQIDILIHNANYFRLTLIPLAVMIVPLVLTIAQLQFHYGYDGLEPGESTLVKVQLAETWQDSGRPAIDLTVPEGLEIEQGPVWIPSERELVWRMAAREQGSYELGFQLDGTSYTKSVVVADHVVRRSPVRVKGFWDQLIYPAEAPLPAGSPIDQISVDYPGADLGIVNEGSEWLWMIVFFLLSVVFAFALRKPLGVTI